MIYIKICGIRTITSAQAALQAGANFIGLNFIPHSKRIITIEKAKEITHALRGNLSVVGIFQNQSLDEVNTIIEEVGLDYVQLHGNEDQQYINAIKAKIIKAFSIPSNFNVEEVYQQMKMVDVDYYLLDREKQGEGQPLSNKKLQQLSKKIPFFLAGGLNPTNVSSIISYTKPFAVDVAGGIETEGMEDIDKIITFIQQATQ